MHCGYNYKEIYDIFKKYCKQIKYFNLLDFMKTVLNNLVKSEPLILGLNSGQKIEKIICKMAKNKSVKNINEVKMPLLIPSVDLHSGKIYYFCSKLNRAKVSDEIIYDSNINLGKAVRASCSYPFIFSPCKYNNTELIDGGIRENTPWYGIKQLGADKTISIVFEKEINEKCCKNIIDVVNNSLDILIHELSNYELKGTDYLIRIMTKNISLLDMKKIDYLYELGYEITKKYIKKYIINNK